MKDVKNEWFEFLDNLEWPDREMPVTVLRGKFKLTSKHALEVVKEWEATKIKHLLQKFDKSAS